MRKAADALAIGQLAVFQGANDELNYPNEPGEWVRVNDPNAKGGFRYESCLGSSICLATIAGPKPVFRINSNYLFGVEQPKVI